MSVPIKVSTYNIIGIAYVSAVSAIPLSAYPETFFTSGAVSGIATDQSYVWFLSGNSYTNLIIDFSWEKSKFHTLLSYSPVSAGISAYDQNYSTSGVFNYGDVVIISTSASPAWTFLNWLENGEVLTINPSYTFTIHTDRTFVAKYQQAPLVCYFTYDVDEYDPLSVDFQGGSNSLSPITSWDWDYGDDTTHGTTQNPSHTYSGSGTYQVTLSVTNSNGETDSYISNVIVSDGSGGGGSY